MTDKPHVQSLDAADESKPLGELEACGGDVYLIAAGPRLAGRRRYALR